MTTEAMTEAEFERVADDTMRDLERALGDVDGIEMDQTEFDLQTFAADGSLLHRRSGNQMISREWRLFFSDTEHFENAFGDVEDTVSRPMTFAFPGDAGFLSSRPQFGCDQMMTDAGGLIPAAFQPGAAP